jgi:predicted dehydrogenase/nucleoside-diphosphate-sugar epimerase
MTTYPASPPRFRVGMIGAGNICEFHVAAVRALPDVKLIGVTDLDLARRKAAEDKLGVKSFESLDALVAAGANVIHVLTPPSAHAKVAMQALDKGCHVLIEKPVAEDVEDAKKIGELARKKGLTASVDHSLLYDPQVMRALEAVRSGSLGNIVSVDILRGSDFPPYEGGPLPPWYRDAGYPLRDLGVHCLYMIQELLGPIEQVKAVWCSLGGDPNLAFDEWRAVVRCKRGLGQFQLTWNVKPMQSQIIIHGTKGVLRVDLFAMFHGKRSSTPLPKAAERLVNAFTDSIQPLIDVPIGVWKFLRKQVQPFQGIRNLVADFYKRLAAGEPPPVSIDDAAQVVFWVEKIARAAEADAAARLAKFKTAATVPYLVTGASGSLGGAVVRRLVGEGKKVRVMVRRIPEKPVEGVEYVFGNLGDPEAVDRAVKGAETVIHVGAAMKGGWPEHLGGTVVGTRNVVESVLRHKTRQLVHISSMSVIDWASSSAGVAVSEQTALEPRAEERGAYTRAKLEAERIVAEAVAIRGLPAVILRPGQIFGSGIPLLNGAVARRVGSRWLVLGDGKLTLPLVYIEDVVDAIRASIDRQLKHGEIIQIIDRDVLTQEQVLEILGYGTLVLRVPRPIVFALGKLSEYPLGALKRPSPVALYRLQSALARLSFKSDRAEKLLGWQPKVGVRDGIRREAP